MREWELGDGYGGNVCFTSFRGGRPLTRGYHDRLNRCRRRLVACDVVDASLIEEHCDGVARRTGGREGDATYLRPTGSSTTQRHDGRPTSELRHVSRSVHVAAGRIRRRQDEARPISNKDLQKSHRKHSRPLLVFNSRYT